MAGRVLYAGLALLDRQLVDREGRLCGKVDDLELTGPDADGRLYVSAIVSGPGAVLLRFGHTRLGGWLRRFLGLHADGRGAGGRIPFQRVADIGNHLTLSIESEEAPSFPGERWVRDHVIDHIPGNR